jgi:hypothetical protein
VIRDDILQDLRNGMSLVDVKKKYRSKSQLYEALRLFLDGLEKSLSSERENFQKVREKLSRTNAEFQSVESDRIKVAEEVAKLRREKQGQVAEVVNMTEKRDLLRLEVKRLEEKGFSPEILKQLKSVEARSGQELLSRVQTAEKHGHLEKELVGLEKRIGDLNGEVKALELQKKSSEQMMVSEGNALDELKRKTASYREAVDTVASVRQEDYRPGVVKSVIHGLKVFGIKGNSPGSVARLVEGLDKMKTLFAVDEQLRRRRVELADLNRAYAQVKGELAVIREITLKTIGEIRDVSKQVIAGVGEQARKETLQTTRSFELRADESISKIDVKLQDAAERHRAELKELTELEHRKAELEQVLGPGLALVGVLKSPEDLKKVPASFVMQLLERTQPWFEMNMPNSSIHPTEAIRAKDRSLLPINSYKPSSLIELAKEGLKQFMIQQGKASAVVRR